MAIAAPSKPVVRRFGLLCVKIETDGISLKGYRRRKWRKVCWEEVARLAMKHNPPPAPGLSRRQWENVLKWMGAK